MIQSHTLQPTRPGVEILCHVHALSKHVVQICKCFHYLLENPDSKRAKALHVTLEVIP